MAERSTSAVDVADNSGDEPLTAKAEQATADEVARSPEHVGAGEDAAEADGTGRSMATSGTTARLSPAVAPDGRAEEETPHDAETSEDEAGKDGADALLRPPGDSSGQAPEPTVEPAPKTSVDAPVHVVAPELHSGHKLARRYRLEECVTRLDGFSSWRAMDEKLRRAVGVHLLPAGHPRARSVLAAARSAALLADPRFVQVLDAVEEDDLVYVVHEWLRDATELTAVLASGPLEVHDAYQMVTQVTQAMAAAHREGLSHLRLTPSAVLRTSTGQWRIRGLAVNAALRGITSASPRRTDTEAIGALLYASLTQRWPYEDDAYGLSGLPKDVGLIAPDQVRAGVHRGLSELAMRALVNDGATASRQEPPCTTPDDLVKAISEVPRIPPPEPVFTARPEYQQTTYQQGSYGRTPPGNSPVTVLASPPPPLQSRTGRALKWAVSALLIAALGLGSWQVADTLMDSGKDPGDSGPSQTQRGSAGKTPVGKPLKIDDASEFAPSGVGISEDEVPNAVDGRTSTAWVTPHYNGYPNFGNLENRKQGSGIIVDLGSVQNVTGVDIDLYRSGQKAEVLAADQNATSPSQLGDFTQRLTSLNTVGSKIDKQLGKPVRTRYVLVRITELPPYGTQDQFRGGISEIKVLGSASE